MVLKSLVKYVKKNSKSPCPSQTKVCTGQSFVINEQNPFKAIMHRARFRNKYLRNKTDENKRNYTKQRNYCVSLVRKSEREYYSNLDVKNITDNKTFWKTVKPFLSRKVTSTKKITLIDNDKIVKMMMTQQELRVLSFQILLVILRSLITIIAIPWQKTFRSPF